MWQKCIIRNFMLTWGSFFGVSSSALHFSVLVEGLGGIRPTVAERTITPCSITLNSRRLFSVYQLAKLYVATATTGLVCRFVTLSTFYCFGALHQRPPRKLARPFFLVILLQTFKRFTSHREMETSLLSLLPHSPTLWPLQLVAESRNIFLPALGAAQHHP